MRIVAAALAALLIGALLAACAPATAFAPSTPATGGLEPTELHPYAPSELAVGTSNAISAVLHDKVTEIGLAGENLTFLLQTKFGWLFLKESITDSHGSAYLVYDPMATGSYTIKVSFDGNAAYAPSNASVTVQAVAEPASPVLPLLPATPTIVGIILAVVGGVWATYAFVAVQVLGIRSDKPADDRRTRRANSSHKVEKTMADESEEPPKRVSGSANAGNRATLIVAAVALVLAAAGVGLGAMGALTPKAATYTPTTVSFEMAIVPDIQGAGWDAFVPNTLVVHAGDTVKITVINADEMDHGFELDTFNVNVHIDPGTANATGDVTPSTTVITFVASQTGTFTFKCNVVCGDGHDYMTGTLQVLPD